MSKPRVYSEAYPWALRITYVDVENNMFLTLGGAAWGTRRERDEHLSGIPASPIETNYVLDIMSERGTEDDRLIDAATVERLLGSSIVELIAQAHKEELLRGAQSGDPASVEVDGGSKGDF